MATAEELLRAETAEAWAEYLEACRFADGSRYEEIEPWAWSRMQVRLRAVRARHAALKRKARA